MNIMCIYNLFLSMYLVDKDYYSLSPNIYEISNKIY